MDAIILAAGLGTRLRPHTLDHAQAAAAGPAAGRSSTGRSAPCRRASIASSSSSTTWRADRGLPASSSATSHWARSARQTPRGTGDAVRRCRERTARRTVPGPQRRRPVRRRRPGRAGPTAGRRCWSHPVDEPQKFGIAFLRPDGTLETLVEKPEAWPAGSWPTPGRTSSRGRASTSS